ncbi:MAG: SDR family NAD(P)-dependent oxidoreductase [Oscillospiraceae bacterium]
MSVDMTKWCEIAKANMGKRPAGEGRLGGKICIVTGAAQGFGKGIAEELYKEGATIVIADMNEPLAKQVAEEMGERAVSIAVNVSDEESVANMVAQTVEKFGGLDLMLSNAGVVRSGPIAHVEKKDFDFVTSVNYTGFFLCAKYAAIIMEAEHEADPEAMFDIVTLNSKSGLEGSNKNFAYAGSKFGGIGLTQSFALELCAYNIKVNAVCPGNFLDGPLWSDPVRGLFVQYLEAGKVPGAKTVADVRRYYEAKVPMNRGCLPVDVARAVMYCVEQKYETGQAIPVTGGQVMLKIACPKGSPSRGLSPRATERNPHRFACCMSPTALSFRLAGKNEKKVLDAFGASCLDSGGPWFQVSFHSVVHHRRLGTPPDKGKSVGNCVWMSAVSKARKKFVRAWPLQERSGNIA